MLTISLFGNEKFMNRNVVLLKESQHTDLSTITLWGVLSILTHFNSSITVKNDDIFDNSNDILV